MAFSFTGVDDADLDEDGGGKGVLVVDGGELDGEGCGKEGMCMCGRGNSRWEPPWERTKRWEVLSGCLAWGFI